MIYCSYVFQDTGTGYADQIVTIILEDANDNRPSFLGTNNRGWLELSLNEGNYSQVPLPGEVVAQLRATDLDRTAPFNEVRYLEFARLQASYREGGFLM